jgi:hypothetical protein
MVGYNIPLRVDAALAFKFTRNDRDKANAKSAGGIGIDIYFIPFKTAGLAYDRGQQVFRIWEKITTESNAEERKREKPNKINYVAIFL